ncbi:MAG: MmcQ/YjbR family DNA-binding protein [Blastocatellia bacterium]
MNKPRTKTLKHKPGPVTFETVRQLALELPEVEEGTSYGTPAFRVGGKILARFHQDGESLVLKVEFAAREVLIGAKPDTFYISDHYACWPLMLVRLSRVSLEDLRRLLEEAWRGMAPKRALRAWESIAGGR